MLKYFSQAEKWQIENDVAMETKFFHVMEVRTGWVGSRYLWEEGEWEGNASLHHHHKKEEFASYREALLG